MTEHKDRIEHTLEVLVYAPIGVGLYLKDMGPTFVNMFVARGRAEVDRRQAQVQQRTTTAKSIGQVAMTFGVPMVRQRVEREVDSARQRAQSFLGVDRRRRADGATRTPSAGPTATARRPRPRARRPERRANGRERAPRRPAAATRCRSPATTRCRRRRWSSGSPASRRRARRGARVRGAHRNRRTILGKIDQISA